MLVTRTGWRGVRSCSRWVTTGMPPRLSLGSYSLPLRCFATEPMSEDVGEALSADIHTKTNRTFQQMGVSTSRLDILHKFGFEKMFPIQEKTYRALRDGRDVIGRAKTGTGKTLAYLLPLIERYEGRTEGGPNRPFTMILVPTRELALQVNKEACRIAPKLRVISVYGGHPVTTQDIVVGTPGRVLHFIQSNTIQVDGVEAFVLDEADQMLDTGFKKDLELILRLLPAQKQTVLFSATLPHWVREMSKVYFQQPALVDLVMSESRKTPDRVVHQQIPVSLSQQRIIVLSRLIARYRNEKMLVFVNTKADCAQLAASPLISFSGQVRALHGDIKQEERASVLDGFRQGMHNVIIATDVASRGLDITDIDVVVHYNIPKSTESYIHRSGRCGRAGRFGQVISIVGGKESFLVQQIEKHVGFSIPPVDPPSEQDIAHIRSDGIRSIVEQVEDRHAAPYLELADSLLQSHGKEILAKALCVLSGRASAPFSYLNGTEGYTTLRVSSKKAAIAKVDAVTFLHKMGGKQFGLAQICPDGSTVIDCEWDQVPVIMERYQRQVLSDPKNPMRIDVVDDLPHVTPSEQVLSFRQGAIDMDKKYASLRSPSSPPPRSIPELQADQETPKPTRRRKS